MILANGLSLLAPRPPRAFHRSNGYVVGRTRRLAFARIPLPSARGPCSLLAPRYLTPPIFANIERLLPIPRLPQRSNQMAITEADVQTRLRALIDPNTGKDFVSGKAVKKVQIGAGDVVIDIQLGYPAKSQ